MLRSIAMTYPSTVFLKRYSFILVRKMNSVVWSIAVAKHMLICDRSKSIAVTKQILVLMESSGLDDLWMQVCTSKDLSLHMAF